jgi:tRNA threonylcarbamoyladenosine biosynthesis protein TsaE
MERALVTRGPEETAAIGRRLAASAPPSGVLALSGPLGAGKTVLAQAVLAGLGVPGPHPSPTFTLLRRYPRPGGGWVWHVDAYRLAGADDDPGWEDVFAADALALVEWPEHLDGLLPADRLEVAIARPAAGPAEARRLKLRAGGPGAAAWLAAALAGWGEP